MQRTRSTRRYLKKQKSWAQKCKDFIREFVAFMFSNVGIIGLVIGYTIAGSFMFIAIETRQKEDKVGEVSRLRVSTVEALWEATCCRLFDDSAGEWARRVEETLAAFQSQLVVHIQEGGYEGTDVTEQTRWSFSGAFLYSLTVITTIGYGNIAPRTGWGKLATILYAIVGMPLFLLYLSNIGDILAKSFKWTYAKCCLCRGCKQNRDDSFSSSIHNQVSFLYFCWHEV